MRKFRSIKLSDEVIKHSVVGSVAEIILSRPKHYNSFNQKLRSDLFMLLNNLEAETKIRVVILRGSGPGFCAGADLTEPFPPPISKHLEKDYKPIFDLIVRSRYIYIASVHGSAAGIGAALAMACDFIIMSETAKLSMVFTNIGLVPDGGSTWFLEKALGYRKALELIVEGNSLEAKECLEYGLINKIVSEDRIENDTLKWAKKLSDRAPLASAAAKRLLRKNPNHNFEEAFMAEALEQDALSVSEDFSSARAAFFKKEKPFFKGK